MQRRQRDGPQPSPRRATRPRDASTRCAAARRGDEQRGGVRRADSRAQRGARPKVKRRQRDGPQSSRRRAARPRDASTRCAAARRGDEPLDTFDLLRASTQAQSGLVSFPPSRPCCWHGAVCNTDGSRLAVLMQPESMHSVELGPHASRTRIPAGEDCARPFSGRRSRGHSSQESTRLLWPDCTLSNLCNHHAAPGHTGPRNAALCKVHRQVTQSIANTSCGLQISRSRDPHTSPPGIQCSPKLLVEPLAYSWANHAASSCLSRNRPFGERHK